jgi:L-threonylcarbamoyladenylate synthase
MNALSLSRAVRALHTGGVIAYPTEAVWGLGCEPRDRDAVEKLLDLKHRDWRKGLILIASDLDQLRPFFARLNHAQLKPALESWPGPHTWLLPASPEAPGWITGGRPLIAVRVTAHPTAAALCRAYGSALVSTSANLAGRAPARNALQVRRQFEGRIDYVVPGPLGGLSAPTPIRELETGRLLRG